MEYQLTVEEKKWNKLWELWANGEVKSPYYEIMEYSSEVNNGGHAQFFSNLGDLKELEEAKKVLLKELPEIFIKKLNKAYLKDEFGRKASKLADKCDDVFYANEKMINEFLQTNANTLEL